MKKRIAAALAALTLLLSGCQATPEEGIIASKNDGAFESALENSPAAESAGGQQTAPAAEPVVYEDSFDGEQGSGGVKFHVRLEEPAVPGPIPVLRVRPLELDGELVHKVAQALFGDAPVTEYTGQMTRAELEEALLAEKQRYADWQFRIEQDPTLDADDRDYVRQSFEERIARLEQQCVAAPEAIEPKTMDWQFHEESYYPNYYGLEETGRQLIMGLGQYNGDTYELDAFKRLGDDYKVQRLSFYPYVPEVMADDLSVSQEQAEPPQVDMEAARAKALEVANSLGVGEYAVVPDIAMEAAKDNVGFGPNTVWLTPVYGGVPLTYHFGGDNVATKTSDAYATTYGYEKMTFDFDEDGMTGFGWESMHQVVETVNENVQLLPFADVLSAAENQMRIMDMERKGLLSQGAVLSIEVTDVTLGMSRIRMKDSATDYYMTPTYTFYGTATYCDKDGEPIRFPVYDEAGNDTGQTTTFAQVTELAVINAVDGTAIDVWKGY